MTELVKKTKTAVFFIAAPALALLIAGCNKDEKTVSTAPEASATEQAAPETIDLSQQASDLFEQPIQPNPLAISAEDVVVTVNGQKITHGEIMQGVQMNMMQMSRRMPPQQLSKMAPQIYQNVIDTLVANILLAEAAEKSSLTINDDDLAKEIADIEADAPEGSTLKDALAENNIDFDEWKNDLRKQMLIRKLVEEKTASVPDASLDDVTKFYKEHAEYFTVPESVTASHILLAFKDDETDATKAQKKADLEKIRADILAGGDFEALAAEKSDCPSKARGGNLGSFSKGQMVPEFEEAAFVQEVGTLSDIVETQYGYHLIKTSAHEPAGVRSLDEVKDQLTSYLTGQTKQEALKAYVEELKGKASIEIRKPDLDAAAGAQSAQ